MDERFARLLSIGVSQVEAYKRSGFAPDKSNASKRAREARIIERVAELREEEAAKLAKRRAEVGDKPGVEELKAALSGAAAAGQWSAVVSAAKSLAEMDGSAAALTAEREGPTTPEELLKIAERNGPRWVLALQLMAVKTDIANPYPPDSDIDVCIDGLSRWFSERQLQELGQRLVSQSTGKSAS
jgi:hypothetical protein